LGADAALTERIETVRGLAVVLLVFFHATLTTLDTAVRTAGLQAMVLGTHLFDYIRMPLFGFLAGFVYAFKPLSRATCREFTARKVTRLMVPCVIATTLMFTLQAAGRAGLSAGLPLHEAWRIYVYPTYQFWFIQALLVDFALLALLEAVGALSTVGRCVVVLMATIIALVWLPAPPIELFSIPQAEYLLPFFLLGLGVNRFRAQLPTSTVVSASLALLFAGLAIHSTSIGDPGYRLDRGSLLGVAIGCSAGLCAIYWMPRFQVLRLLGGYSFAIFLYHYLFIGVAAHLCKQADFRAALPLGAVLIGVGIGGPMVVHYAVRSNRALRSAMLGMR
jgi:surface polysaccharide O-acyltransferase-like enzyme